MRHRRLLKALCLACLFMCTVASLAAEKSNGNAPERVSVKLGSVESIEVPASWHLEKTDQSGSCSFLKGRSSWWDCLINVRIKSPVQVSPDLAIALQRALKLIFVTKTQMADLKNLPDVGTTDGDNDKLKGTICSIGGKRILLLEHSGKFTGPCEPTAGGRTRRTLLSYVRGTPYLLTGVDTVHTISFDSDVMGDISPCRKQFGAILSSINWLISK